MVDQITISNTHEASLCQTQNSFKYAARGWWKYRPGTCTTMLLRVNRLKEPIHSSTCRSSMARQI